jgi:CIC family chloride channel protein
LLAGAVAIAFRRTLEIAEHARGELYAVAHARGAAGLAGMLVLGAVAAGFSLWLVQRFAPEAAGSGIPHLKAVLHHLRPLRWRRVLPVKFLSGAAAIGAGLALGREGPTVQMGGSVGQMTAGWLAANPRERQVLVAAGAGAGLAAAFNAPLAGVLFVLEELQGHFAPGVLTAAFVASFVADLATRFALGQNPIFRVDLGAAPPLADLPWFLCVGILAGVLGVAFNRGLLGSLRLFEWLEARTRRLPSFWPAAAVGAAVAAVGWALPGALGGGGPLVAAAFAGQTTLAALAGLLALRYALTMVSYGTGTAGGIFAPLLVLGAQLGVLTAGLGGRWIADPSPATAFAAVGMAALFTAVVRAPLTGIVLLLEMTADYAFVLPLLGASFAAYGVANLLGDQPIYEALLERDTLRASGDAELEAALFVEHVVEPGSRFDGRRIGELGLPPGALVVTVHRGHAVLVPDRDTRLTAGDRLRTLIAPQAAGAAGLLHSGTRA